MFYAMCHKLPVGSLVVWGALPSESGRHTGMFDGSRAAGAAARPTIAGVVGT
jgi:hypothetical protein